MAGTLIRGGRIVSEGRVFQGDVLFSGEQVLAVDKKIDASADAVIDAAGCEVFPGGVDPHVHLELKSPEGTSSDDFVSGTRAALAGGTTTILDFVTPPRGASLLGALAERKAAAAKSLCDYGLHMSVTAWNERLLPELETCCRREGIASVKTYLAYKGTIGLDDDEFLSVLDAASRLRFLTMVHAESGDMVSFLQRKLLAEGKRSAAYHPQSRPAEVEGEAVGRALLMARLAGVPLYVVHVSSRQGIDALATARKAGQAAIAETCPQYLILDEGRYRQGGDAAAAAVMSPPLREREHQAVLWQALAAGLLQAIGTDHCPFLLEDKRRHGADDFTGIPGGTGGIELRLALLYNFGVRAGRITLPRFVDLVATRPAKIFGLFPRKGTIRPGSDADLVVWDPGRTWTVAAQSQWQRCDHTLYEGLELQGAPRLVIARGEVAFAEGAVHVEAGRGLFLERGRGGDATRR